MAVEAQDVLLAGLWATPLTAPDLTPRERAVLAYADVVTLSPADVTRAHIDAIREAGYDDLSIHDSCAIIAYFAFVNRIADGLGVELEIDPPGTDHNTLPS